MDEQDQFRAFQVALHHTGKIWDRQTENDEKRSRAQRQHQRKNIKIKSFESRPKRMKDKPQDPHFLIMFQSCASRI